MPKLQTLASTSSAQDILAAIARDGACILKGVLDTDQIARLRDEIMPYVDATRNGRDAFSGVKTTRTGALIARSPTCRELVTHQAIVEAANIFLKPYCERIQLHLTQVIRIRPGQPRQPIHRDRWAWGTYLKNIEPQFTMILAVSDFTRANGATNVVPGSVDWPDERRPTEDEIGYAEMSAGSAIIYSGATFHGGGENSSTGDRVGIIISYALGWLRQEENQYLSCPPEIAKDLTPELQALLGYAEGGYSMGYYTPPLAPGKGPELVPPQFALGAKVEGNALGSAELLAEKSKVAAG